MDTFKKQPGETIVVDVRLVDWLAPGETITNKSATADAGISLAPLVQSGTTLQQQISGGTHGAAYHVTVTVSTSNGRVKEIDFRVRVKEV